MIFNLEAASGYAALEEFPGIESEFKIFDVKTSKGPFVDFKAKIEINSIEELINFQKHVGKIIIDRDDCEENKKSALDTLTIIIYDSYVE